MGMKALLAEFARGFLDRPAAEEWMEEALKKARNGHGHNGDGGKP